ncbi:MAG TPA: MMPL family transporter [Solirubrobacteraceae bacterium]|nr:MMPL family transporter [Solirubrobacteraceae bacterium]
MLDSLARRLYRRRRRVLIGAVLLVIVAGAVGGPVAGLLDSDDDFDPPAAEAVQAREAIADATGASAAPDVVALVRLGAPAGSAAGQARLREVAGAAKGSEVARVDAYSPGGPEELVSRDGRSSYVAITLRDDADADALVDRLEGMPGVVLGGPEVVGEQAGEQVQEDLARAEMLAFPLLFLVLLVVFRGVVAALLPLAVGMVTVLSTFLLMRGVNEIEPMSVFALNLIIGLGLGLAIDYSLFMVSRFREEVERRRGTADALAATLRTAGRTVLFSAVTVAAALASLTLFPQRFLFSMGIGGVLVSLVAATVSLTILPALLGALGPRVNALSPARWRAAMHKEAARVEEGFWYRHSRRVMRHPGVIAATTAVLLLALGLPFTQIGFTGVDARVLGTSHSARVVDDALRTEFPPNRTSPVLVAVEAPPSERPQVERYARRLGELPGVLAIQPPQSVDGLWRIGVVATGQRLDESAKDTVRAVRAVDAPFPVQVGGSTAEFLDQQAALADRIPLALAVLATTTLVILFVMTGSVVLPVKTLIMNLLTLSAAFGILKLIFQDGRFEGVLGYTSQGALESSQPVLLFATAFGLSTDYGVFLLTRIKEARDAGLRNDEAVAVGLQRTGRIVTAAAILFCIAIGAFVTSEMIFIKQLGLGTALAVLIDATIVRALLVPSLMRLLGEWNWWAPRPLARLHARIAMRAGA